VTVSSTSTHPEHIKLDTLKLDESRKRIYDEDGTVLVMESSLNKFLTYQAQLFMTMTKFPDDKGPVFEYSPVFPSDNRTSNPIPIRSLLYELVCTLYNLSSLYTHLALQHRSTTRGGDSLKISINYFQSSLGVLDKLKSLLPKLDCLKCKDLDLDFNRQVIEGFREYLKACIQELGWQKSIVDRLKNGTIAKLAIQVSIYYENSLNHFHKHDYLPIEWKNFLRLKCKHFQAVGQYRRSLDDLGSNRYGDEIGRLNKALECLKIGLNFTTITTTRRGGGGGVGGVLDIATKESKSFLKVLEQELKRANKDNDLIYLNHPTPFSSLPPITPFPLARSTRLTPLTTPLLFSSMDRKEIDQVLEIWKDRTSNWFENDFLKEWKKRLDTNLKNNLNDLRIEENLDLPLQRQQPLTNSISTSTSNTVLITPQQRIVPDYLIEKSQELIRLGGISRLETLFKDVRKISLLNKTMLIETNDYLQQQQQPSSTTQQHCGNLLIERFSHFSSLINQANESDLLVRKKYADSSQYLEILQGGLPKLETVIPPPPPAISTPSTNSTSSSRTKEEIEEEENRLELMRKLKRKLRGSIDELKDLELERLNLSNRVIKLINSWDIKPKILEKSNQHNHQLELVGVGVGVQEGEELDGDNNDHSSSFSELEMFEEILRDELLQIEKTFKEEMNWNEQRQGDLLEELKTLNSSFVSLVNASIRQNTLNSSSSTDTPPTISGKEEEEDDESTAEISSTTSRRRQEVLQELSLCHSKFLEILNNLEEGLKFYTDLTRLVSELRDSAKEVS